MDTMGNGCPNRSDGCACWRASEKVAVQIGKIVPLLDWNDVAGTIPQVVTANTVVTDPFSQKLCWQSLVRSSFRWLTDSLRSLSSHLTISQKPSNARA